MNWLVLDHSKSIAIVIKNKWSSKKINKFRWTSWLSIQLILLEHLLRARRCPPCPEYSSEWCSHFCRKQIFEEYDCVPGSGLDSSLTDISCDLCIARNVLYTLRGGLWSEMYLITFVPFGKYLFIMLSLNIYFSGIYRTLALFYLLGHSREQNRNPYLIKSIRELGGLWKLMAKNKQVK